MRSPQLGIGLAFSRDGTLWEKSLQNPVLSAGRGGDWDSQGVYCPVVWNESGKWHMMFTGYNREAHYQVGYAESDDGISWTKARDNPRFCDSSLGHNKAGVPETEGWGLLKSASNYFLLYNTVTIKPRQIFVAKSTNLTDWAPTSSAPLIPSEGMPDDLGYMKYCAWPACLKGQLFVFVATSNESYSKSAIGVWELDSLDHNAKKGFVGYLMNPNENWCAAELDTPFVMENLKEPDQVYMYFAGRSTNNNWYEGLSTLIL